MTNKCLYGSALRKSRRDAVLMLALAGLILAGVVCAFCNKY